MIAVFVQQSLLDFAQGVKLTNVAARAFEKLADCPMDGGDKFVNPNVYPYVTKNGGRRWFAGGFFADHICKALFWGS